MREHLTCLLKNVLFFPVKARTQILYQTREIAFHLWEAEWYVNSPVFLKEAVLLSKEG